MNRSIFALFSLALLCLFSSCTETITPTVMPGPIADSGEPLVAQMLEERYNCPPIADYLINPNEEDYRDVLFGSGLDGLGLIEQQLNCPPIAIAVDCNPYCGPTQEALDPKTFLYCGHEIAADGVLGVEEQQALIDQIILAAEEQAPYCPLARALMRPIAYQVFWDTISDTNCTWIFVDVTYISTCALTDLGG